MPSLTLMWWKPRSGQHRAPPGISGNSLLHVPVLLVAGDKDDVRKAAAVQRKDPVEGADPLS